MVAHEGFEIAVHEIDGEFFARITRPGAVRHFQPKGTRNNTGTPYVKSRLWNRSADLRIVSRDSPRREGQETAKRAREIASAGGQN